MLTSMVDVARSRNYQQRLPPTAEVTERLNGRHLNARDHTCVAKIYLVGHRWEHRQVPISYAITLRLFRNRMVKPQKSNV